MHCRHACLKGGLILAVSLLVAPVLIDAMGRSASTTSSTTSTTHPSALGVDILVNGVAQPQYAHEGRWYLEALKGREYAVRLTNPFPVRVAVALSVDGLNTIDAQRSTAGGAQKWVLAPFQTVTISGWQISQHEARRFEFTTEERSYGHALGRTDNLGVISAAFFKERAYRPTPEARRERLGERDRAPRATAPDANAAAGGSELEAQAPASADGPAERQRDEYAATGMGRPTDHRVTRVWLDLEDAPAHTVDLRYEFRPQLVKLGILPRDPSGDRLTRRERARGFEPGFAPVLPRR